MVNFCLFLICLETLFFAGLKLVLDDLLISDFVAIAVLVPYVIEFVVHKDGPVEVRPLQDLKELLVHVGIRIEYLLVDLHYFADGVFFIACTQLGTPFGLRVGLIELLFKFLNSALSVLLEALIPLMQLLRVYNQMRRHELIRHLQGLGWIAGVAGTR